VCPDRACAEGLQNGFVDSFNGRLRDELLNETMFRGLAHARELLIEWRRDYNAERPHTSLDGLTPNEFARRSRRPKTPDPFRSFPASSQERRGRQAQ
jgi:transposase InsO family protein